MDEYTSVQNISKLTSAVAKMLRDKFNISLTEDKLKLLINNISQDVEDEYEDSSFKINELNNITLSKIKQLVQKQKQEPVTQPQQPESNFSNEDMILAKVRELEAQRRFQTSTELKNIQNQTSTFKVAPVSDISQLQPQQPSTAAQPLAAAQPQQQAVHNLTPAPQIIHQMYHQDHIHYKSFIINSVNRDWIKFPNRNNLKFNIPVSPTHSYNFYPDCISFPIFVKNITPYVLANFSDGLTSFTYTFIPTATAITAASKWDKWNTIDNPEKLVFSNKQWTIKFFDFLNNELDLGSDDVNIVEAAYFNDDHFVLKYDKQISDLSTNAHIMLKARTDKVHCKRIIDHSADDKLLTIKKNELTLDDFMNSKMMLTTHQFSIIVKYHFIV
jgi:hypothetical protein